MPEPESRPMLDVAARRRLHRVWWLAAVVAVLAAAVLVWAQLEGNARWRLIAKPWPVLSMIAVLVAVPGPAPAYRRRLCLGLVMSVVGDLLLEGEGHFFLAGMAAFLVAHLFYISAFWLGEKRWRPVWALPFAAWGAWVISRLWPGLLAAGMTVPVIVYTAVICAMLWRAAARLGGVRAAGVRAAGVRAAGIRAAGVRAAGVRATGGAVSGAILAAGGAALFAASDSMIAFSRFGEPFAGASFLIIALYWLGQLGLTLSALPRFSGE